MSKVRAIGVRCSVADPRSGVEEAVMTPTATMPASRTARRVAATAALAFFHGFRKRNNAASSRRRRLSTVRQNHHPSLQAVALEATKRRRQRGRRCSGRSIWATTGQPPGKT
jgi:hypothetical protein